ncbi:methyl-accepting chemotaxis protein [Candidatus Symbiopectobacterium sp. NZEC127]|uniref:methyl-accepting chemotaxis protein n=1 Tax=Candidatus Symbiopectobacterium sp. NZEC127 TaxID=2820472 RepID=UPI002227EE0C|nr:methyl-accepting chemotaxis protein [Candidatus Symbiopectobacterium sp. NZEC127]MCW2488070.1 methyl-accepting chemotaxis protein [Candidatus Symbiopectobacterium sp. NZEC127]
MAIKFENITVGKKLGLGFFLVLLLTALIAGAGINYIESLQESIQKVNLSNQINTEVNQAKYYRARFGANYDLNDIKQNSIHIDNINTLVAQAKTLSWSTQDIKTLDNITTTINSYKQQRQNYLDAVTTKDKVRKSWSLDGTDQAMSKLDDQLRATGDSQSQQLLLADFKTKLMTVRFHLNNLLLERTKAAEETLTDAINDAQTALTFLSQSLSVEQRETLDPVLSTMNHYEEQVLSYMPAYQKEMESVTQMNDIAVALSDRITELLNAQLQQTDHNVRTSEIQLTVTALITLLAGLLIAWFISRQITAPLTHTLTIAERIATGDLTMNMSTSRRDELGQLLNAMAKMNGNLHQMIDDIRVGVGQISTAASEIVAGNTDLSSRTEQQAAAVEQTAASMEQLTATVKQNADNASHANKLVVNASQTAKQGGEQVGHVVQTMVDIEQSSKRIAEITSVINSIAFQTNILALNAAVEAARAGEQGRGFAVVAGEVRNLAQRSSQAAKEIEGLISESVTQISQGANLVTNAGKTMDNIVKSVTQVHDIMGEIATASEEQSRGIAQVSQAIAEMDGTTQQNAALVEQSAAAANSLEEQTQVLTEAVSVFRLTQAADSATPALGYGERPAQLDYQR